MSRFLPQPATWPALALNPEPRGTAADGDSIERLYQEWFGTTTPPDPQLMPSRQEAKGARHLGYTPSTRVRQFTRR